jgi:signal transduction histidine kinase
VGLGLSIARWIADLHHAEIDLRSEVGLGTSITVWFPRGAATPSDAGAAEA